MRVVSLVLLSIVGPACVAAPPGPPENVVSSLIEDIDAGREGSAAERFRATELEPGYHERLYPLLYGAARDRYDRADTGGAARILRFMEPRYPEAVAVREALLYCLFLERAKAESPEPELAAAIAEQAVELQEGSLSVPRWLGLIEAQAAIDQGRLVDARRHLDGFLVTWDGQPESLLLYVEDMERYLRSH